VEHVCGSFVSHAERIAGGSHDQIGDAVTVHVTCCTYRIAESDSRGISFGLPVRTQGKPRARTVIDPDLALLRHAPGEVSDHQIRVSVSVDVAGDRGGLNGDVAAPAVGCRWA